MKTRVLITLCILSGVLFIISGLSKLFPAELFELTLVNAHITNWNYAPYLARFIIAIELFLGISLLQKNQIRKIIAGAMVLLAIFSLHLAYTLYMFGNTGNCGCFGELLPMSPLSALIKNIVLLIVLDFVYIEYKHEEKGKLLIPLIILVVSFVGIFIISPIQKHQSDEQIILNSKTDGYNPNSTSIGAPSDEPKELTDSAITQDNKKETPKETPQLMNKSTSPFGQFHYFSDSTYVDLDKGIKLTALLSLDCEHCMAAAKEIAAFRKTTKLPVYFLYLGETEQLSNFYANSGAERIPYKILNARTFFPLLKESPPRIVLLNNGNIIGDWDSKDFSIKALKSKLK